MACENVLRTSTKRKYSDKRAPDEFRRVGGMVQSLKRLWGCPVRHHSGGNKAIPIEARGTGGSLGRRPALHGCHPAPQHRGDVVLEPLAAERQADAEDVHQRRARASYRGSLSTTPKPFAAKMGNLFNDGLVMSISIIRSGGGSWEGSWAR